MCLCWWIPQVFPYANIWMKFISELNMRKTLKKCVTLIYILTQIISHNLFIYLPLFTFEVACAAFSKASARKRSPTKQYLSFSIVQSANVRERLLCWTQHRFQGERTSLTSDEHIEFVLSGFQNKWCLAPMLKF